MPSFGNKKRLLMFITVLMLAGSLLPLTASAQGALDQQSCVIEPDDKFITLQTRIPGLTQTMEVNDKTVYAVKDFRCFAAGLYRYLAGVAGVLSAVMMMYGGVRYVFSMGNQQKFQEAQDTIVSAMVGLVLTLGSYVILYTVNPALVTFERLNIPPVSRNLQDVRYTPKLCPVTGNEQDVPCGQTPKVGQKDFGAGRGIVDEHCMGSYCEYGFGGDSATHRQICQLQSTKDPSGEKMFASGNCVSNIPVTGIADTSTVEVINFAFADTPINPFTCGELALNPTNGKLYLGFKTSFGANSGRNYCVLDGKEGIAVEGPLNPFFSNFLTKGFIANMYSAAD